MKPMPACVLLVVLLAGACQDDASRTPAGEPDPDAPATTGSLVENHAHLESDDAHALLLELAAFVGQDLGDEAAASGGKTAAELVSAMDSLGVDRAQALSVAYFFGFPDLDVQDERARVRAENDFVATEVSRFPERLVGACSVNPLADYALEEVTRCADDPRLQGLKLHFANSDVDLRNAEDLDRVGAVFELAQERGLPVVAHVRTRTPEYGRADVEAFIDGVLSRAPTLPVQIAHMAGWGGYDANTREAMATFIQAFRSGRLNPSLYTFDLAAVVISPARAEGDTAMAREFEAANRALAEQIRELGTDRVLFASDWATVSMAETLEAARRDLPLEATELRDILDNRGPLLR